MAPRLSGPCCSQLDLASKGASLGPLFQMSVALNGLRLFRLPSRLYTGRVEDVSAITEIGAVAQRHSCTRPRI